MTTSVQTGGERWNDLDAVRALALFLGIVLHGVMSFMEPRFWIVGDSVTDTGANALGLIWSNACELRLGAK